MPWNAQGTQTINTTPSQLSVTNAGAGTRLVILRRGDSAVAEYYIGSSSSVSSSTGLKVRAAIFELDDFHTSDPIWAVTASGSCLLSPEVHYAG